GLSPALHPENNLTEIFGINDRVNSYQSGPRNSLGGFNSAGGFAISYSGSLIDNVRQLGSVGQLVYGSGWNNGYKEARGWKTPAGSTRMDLVGFTYHLSLAPLLPKSVLRKEIQTFKQAWWKAWGGNSDLSDHSKGFFPTEMGYSRHIVDVLVEEGYEWVIVPSHHISRTSPSYNTKANPEGSYNIFSSPPNKADQLGPISTNGWWYSEPNPGNAAWNLAPFAYQLHKVKYVNPETGAEKTMIAVPSDDVLSYRFGYANEGIGQIGASISPFATDPNRPVIVMPSTDGDNAWGGGSSSWFEATPQFFNNSASAGYKPSTPQDFVNAHSAAAPVTHIEDGGWIFPEMCYGSPNFMKWIEPAVATVANRGVTTVPGTQIDMETPGFALKFYSYAPLMAGANWCETAEQILRDEGGSVQAWKVASPYDWDGTWTSPNEVEQAWHIYLVGLDSGFNYYGGLGNDDEMKPGLATRRAVEKLESWMTPARRNNDRTGPTVLKPQRFPYNPGWYTFGWFNQQPQIPNNAFLKRMNSDFYIWTHAYDLNGISNIVVKVRFDNDGTNSMASNQNETYTGGSEVGSWQTLPMTKRELPKTREALNAAAANSQINYFLPVQTNAVADYYFTKITDTSFRNKLVDYYIEATDTKGNVSRSEIQHVWVDDFSGASNVGSGGGGGGTTPSNVVTLNPTVPVSGQPLTVTYNPAGRALASATNVNIHHGFNQNIAANWTVLPGVAMTKSGSNWVVTYNVASNATTIAMCFNNGSGTWDNNGGGNFNFNVTNAPLTNAPPVPTGLSAAGTSTNTISLIWSPASTASGYVIYRNGSALATNTDANFLDTTGETDTEYTYAVVATNVIGSSPFSSHVTTRTLFAPVSNNILRLVNPTNGIAVTASNYNFRGHAGLWLTNGLRWSNTLNGQTGTISFTGLTNSSGWAWSNTIPLGAGSNQILFFGDYAAPGASQIIGRDHPTNASYNAGWSSGSSGGTGFGAWSFSNSTNAGFFRADSSSTNMNVNSSNGFGLWANNGGIARASRNLPNPMKAGDVLTLRFDNNWINTGSRVGIGLANSSGINRFAFYFIGGEQTYRIDEQNQATNSAVAYNDGGLLLTFELTGANSYKFSAGSSVIQGTLGGSGTINQLVASNSNAGPNTPYNLYLGEMTFSEVQSSQGTTQVSAAEVIYNPITDGIADSWWASYGITGPARVAANDTDGDGFTNAQENALGTSPVDASSTFKVGNIERSGNILSITWPSIAGKKYQVQKRASLSSGAWENSGAQVTAVGTSSSANVDVSDSPNASFVRVILVP
ncbi:MAG: hypothetical protein ACKODZ_08490, partial [Verrucomicrobiota bacterium]